MQNQENKLNNDSTSQTNSSNNSQASLLKEHEVSKIIQRPVATLRRERWARKGIRFVKIGRSVRYRLSDIEEYIEANLIATTQEHQS